MQSQVSDPDWEDLAYFARLIPRVCHNINRLGQVGQFIKLNKGTAQIYGDVIFSSGPAKNLWKCKIFIRICYIFGGPVEHPVIEVRLYPTGK